jgi:hypothetical protein
VVQQVAGELSADVAQADETDAQITHDIDPVGRKSRTRLKAK